MTRPVPDARALALFANVIDLPPPERLAWLASACDDTGLKRTVEAMLVHADNPSVGLLDCPVIDRAAHESFGAPLVGQRVGPWRVTGVLGRGGMGIVYAAERDDASFAQRAALKLVHPSFVSDFGPRFLRERALLASLDHPGVARLLDGGLAPDGAPYLAMERVDGVPITDYADAHGLDIGARVRLFVYACDAVAYAHRNLVVHRDLKPDHIRVQAPDGGSVGVKLLDFGVAKLLDGGEDSLLTHTGATPLTPAYAAPEQLLGKPVTTATDVYSLGVVLYELLAGRRPYEVSTLTAAQAERVVCTTTVTPPSAGAPPDRARALRGDLDTIIGRALAKEPERRYASAEALAADLRRHLDGQPVEARPATARYRAGRFVRRHRVGVGASVLFAVLVIAMTTVYTVRLKAERDLAERATVEAREEADRVAAIAGFLEQILRAPNARWYNEGAATGPDTPIRAVLDEAAARVDRDFADRPDLLADLHHILGDTYGTLGLGDEALRHHRRTLALRESLYTAPDPRIAEALYYLGTMRLSADARESLHLFERAVAMQRTRNEGSNFPFMTADLAGIYLELGRAAESAALAAEGIAFVKARFVPGDDGHRYRDVILLVLTQRHAHALQNLGYLDRAQREIAASDSLLARLPRTAAHYIFWQNQMCAAGSQLRRRGRFAQAEPPLLACYGLGPPRAPASPFPVPSIVQGLELNEQQEWGSVDLVSLYEAWGRPSQAAPFRAKAARTRTRRDSLRAALAPPQGVLTSGRVLPRLPPRRIAH